MQTFAIKGLAVLKRERESIGKDFEHIAVKYYDLAFRFYFGGAASSLIEAMNTELEMDIIAVVKKLDPFSTAIK